MEKEEKNKFYFWFLIKWAIEGIASLAIASFIFGLVAFAVPGPIVKAQLRYHPILAKTVKKIAMQKFTIAKTILDCMVYEKNLSQVSVEAFNNKKIIEKTSTFDMVKGEIKYIEGISRNLYLGQSQLNAGNITFDKYLENPNEQYAELALSYLISFRNTVERIHSQPEYEVIKAIPSLPDLLKEIENDYNHIDKAYKLIIQKVESGRSKNLKEDIAELRKVISEAQYKYSENVENRKKRLQKLIGEILEI
jgi:hypothetical protein